MMPAESCFSTTPRPIFVSPIRYRGCLAWGLLQEPVRAAGFLALVHVETGCSDFIKLTRCSASYILQNAYAARHRPPFSRIGRWITTGRD